VQHLVEVGNRSHFVCFLGNLKLEVFGGLHNYFGDGDRGWSYAYKRARAGEEPKIHRLTNKEESLKFDFITQLDGVELFQDVRLEAHPSTLKLFDDTVGEEDLVGSTDQRYIDTTQKFCKTVSWLEPNFTMNNTLTICTPTGCDTLTGEVVLQFHG
jgi:hypothetical protein